MNLMLLRNILSKTTFSHLKNCYLALNDGQGLSAAIWAAVFLESFLDELFQLQKIGKRGKEDLNGQIQSLRQYSNNPPPDSINIPDEIVKRCDDIRNTRNRLVHDTGLEKDTINEDSKYIVAAIEVILNWYTQIKPIKEEIETREKKDEEENKKLIPVFISTISPHNERQNYFFSSLTVKKCK